MAKATATPACPRLEPELPPPPLPLLHAPVWSWSCYHCHQVIWVGAKAAVPSLCPARSPTVQIWMGVLGEFDTPALQNPADGTGAS